MMVSVESYCVTYLLCYLIVITTAGATDYQSDHSMQTGDHLVNGNAYDDKTEEYCEPSQRVHSSNVEATPQKSRGYDMPFDFLSS